MSHHRGTVFQRSPLGVIILKKSKIIILSILGLLLILLVATTVFFIKPIMSLFDSGWIDIKNPVATADFINNNSENYDIIENDPNGNITYATKDGAGKVKVKTKDGKLEEIVVEVDTSKVTNDLSFGEITNIARDIANPIMSDTDILAIVATGWKNIERSPDLLYGDIDVSQAMGNYNVAVQKSEDKDDLNIIFTP